MARAPGPCRRPAKPSSDMEREANYVAVGAFILLCIGMAVGFLLWYTDANDGRDYDLYEIYFAGSVSGLDRGSPVRYLGVDVGRVRRLSIDTRNTSRVAVVAEIDRSAPISAATRASLGLQGVTGLLYVNLKEAPDISGKTAAAPGRALSRDRIGRLRLRHVPRQPARADGARERVARARRSRFSRMRISKG